MQLLIKELLRSRNMDQKSLAELMGKSASAINLQLNGTPNLKSLTEIADALQVPLSDLFAVPDGYVHWTQRTLHEAQIAEQAAQRSTVGQTYNCPNCGMQMQVTKEPEE